MEILYKGRAEPHDTTQISVIGLAEIIGLSVIKVISMTDATIIAWIGTTYMLASSTYSIGLLLVIASAVLMVATDNIMNWIIGALGAGPI